MSKANELGLELLQSRARRLHSIVKRFGIPEEVITREVALVVQAAFLYSPKHMGESFARMMYNTICQAKDLCIECGEKTANKPLCDDCVRRMNLRVEEITGGADPEDPVI